MTVVTAKAGTADRPLTHIVCPVCRSGAIEPFHAAEDRDYWRCAICEARFLDPRQHPSREAEYGHYLHHENDPADPRYRRFLSKLADPLQIGRAHV